MMRPLPTGALDSSSAYSSGITSVPPLFFSKAAMREKSFPDQIRTSMKMTVNHA